MAIQIVFETHSITEDNERGIATGWLPGRLSEKGRAAARELGARRRSDAIRAVFTSDLRRAVETAEIAFGGTSIPVFHDWRLRECDYGERNGAPRGELERARRDHIDRPYPGGESWREATRRVKRALDDLAERWDGGRVVVIGHMATRWALEHYANGAALEELAGETLAWQPGWEFRLP
jgi:alpha-ribazole phosphatase/probable phosphoglycerate mutase